MNRRYIVRFIRLDNGPAEEYYYDTEADADYHINLFISDDSGLYKFIALFDRQDSLVQRILVFENGSLREDFRNRDVVRLRSGFRSEGEAGYLYCLSNINENMGRCLITCLNGGTTIPTSEMVELEMIDRVTGYQEVTECQG